MSVSARSYWLSPRSRLARRTSVPIGSAGQRPGKSASLRLHVHTAKRYVRHLGETIH